MVHELHTYPFGLSLSKADPFRVRLAHHERNEDIRCCITYARFNSVVPSALTSKIASARPSSRVGKVMSTSCAAIRDSKSLIKRDAEDYGVSLRVKTLIARGFEGAKTLNKAE